MCSIIIFFFDSGSNFIETSQTEPSILAQNSSIIGLSHGFHDLFLSASFQSWSVVVHSVPELSLVLGGSSQQFSLGLSSVVFCGLFTEEVVTVEDPVGPDSETQHPERSDSAQPPLVGLHNEVCVVKHAFFLLFIPLINIIISSFLLFESFYITEFF